MRKRQRQRGLRIKRLFRSSYCPRDAGTASWVGTQLSHARRATPRRPAAQPRRSAQPRPVPAPRRPPQPRPPARLPGGGGQQSGAHAGEEGGGQQPRGPHRGGGAGGRRLLGRRRPRGVWRPTSRGLRSRADWAGAPRGLGDRPGGPAPRPPRGPGEPRAGSAPQGPRAPPSAARRARGALRTGGEIGRWSRAVGRKFREMAAPRTQADRRVFAGWLVDGWACGREDNFFLESKCEAYCLPLQENVVVSQRKGGKKEQKGILARAQVRCCRLELREAAVRRDAS